MPAWLLLVCSLLLGIPVSITIVRSRERHRQERARAFERELAGELLQQASDLDRLVFALGGLADGRDGDRVLERATADARRLVRADHAVLFVAVADGSLRLIGDQDPALDPLRHLAVDDADHAAESVAAALGASVTHQTPLAAQQELIGVLVVARCDGRDGPAEAFAPAEMSQLRVIAEFAARAAQNARLYTRLERLRADAEDRERERARLSNRLAEAEHAERRRLSILLHDGPQQTVASVSLMLDACLDQLLDGEVQELHRVLALARDRNRDAVRDIRELGYSLEPVALREEGLTAALLPYVSRLGEAHAIRFRLDLESADAALTQTERGIVYQIIREAIANAIKHARPTTIALVAVAADDGSSLRISVIDDGGGMKRTSHPDGMSQGMDAMRERAATLGAPIEWCRGELGGTEVRLTVPQRAFREEAA